jgi:hypothetical protein
LDTNGAVVYIGIEPLELPNQADRI